MKNTIILILVVILVVIGLVLYLYRDTFKNIYNKKSKAIKADASHAVKKIEQDIKK